MVDTPFYGGELLRRARQCKEPMLASEERVHRVPLPLTQGRQRDTARISFCDTYGYRGNDARLYYLNPWEFTKWWRLEPLRAPNWYAFETREPWTRWTTAGRQVNFLSYFQSRGGNFKSSTSNLASWSPNFFAG